MVQTDTGPQADGSSIFVRGFASSHVLDNGRETNAKHGLLCAVAREQPAVDVVYWTVILH